MSKCVNSSHVLLFLVLTLFQKVLKEKEIELFTLKNQKLEKLCRALQDERKNLYQKVQENGQPGADAGSLEPLELGAEDSNLGQSGGEGSSLENQQCGAAKDIETKEVLAEETKEIIQEPVTSEKALSEPSVVATSLTNELYNLKAEKARLQETAAALNISEQPVLPAAASEVSQHSKNTDSVLEPQDLTEAITDLEFQLSEEILSTETWSNDEQEIRDKEIETVD